MTFIGIDVSKKTLDVAALIETGELRHHQFCNSHEGHSALNSWLKDFGVCCIVLEATGSYHERLAQALQLMGAHYSVVNPAQTSYFVRSQHRRNKTDKADAVMLAVYAKERQPAPTLATSPLPQSIARELNALQEDVTRLRNRLEAAEQGLTHPEVRRCWPPYNVASTLSKQKSRRWRNSSSRRRKPHSLRSSSC